MWVEYIIQDERNVSSIDEIPDNATIIAIDGNNVAGTCEQCRNIVFADDTHYVDVDGVVLCNYCMDEK